MIKLILRCDRLHEWVWFGNIRFDPSKGEKELVLGSNKLKDFASLW